MSMQAIGWSVTRNLRYYNKLPLIMLAMKSGIDSDDGIVFYTEYDPEELADDCGMTLEEVHGALKNLVARGLIEIRQGQYDDGIWNESTGHTVILNVSKEHRS